MNRTFTFLAVWAALEVSLGQTWAQHNELRIRLPAASSPAAPVPPSEEPARPAPEQLPEQPPARPVPKYYDFSRMMLPAVQPGRARPAGFEESTEGATTTVPFPPGIDSGIVIGPGDAAQPELPPLGVGPMNAYPPIDHGVFAAPQPYYGGTLGGIPTFTNRPCPRYWGNPWVGYCDERMQRYYFDQYLFGFGCPGPGCFGGACSGCGYPMDSPLADAPAAWPTEEIREVRPLATEAAPPPPPRRRPPVNVIPTPRSTRRPWNGRK